MVWGKQILGEYNCLQGVVLAFGFGTSGAGVEDDRVRETKGFSTGVLLPAPGRIESHGFGVVRGAGCLDGASCL